VILLFPPPHSPLHCPFSILCTSFFLSYTDPAPTEIYTLSLHDALPILNEFQTSLTVRYILIDCQKCIWCYFITEFFNLWNQFPMSIYFTHFLFGAQMNGKIYDVLFE